MINGSGDRKAISFNFNMMMMMMVAIACGWHQFRIVMLQ